MAKRPTISRAEFNRQAKELRTDGNVLELQKLAVRLVIPGALAERKANVPATTEFHQQLAEAATKAVSDWWSNSGNCYEKVTKAARNAARNWRGAGWGKADLTWRGGFDKHSRKFSSALTVDDLPSYAKPSEVAERAKLQEEIRQNLVEAFGDASFEEPTSAPVPETDADGTDKREKMEAAQETATAHARERAEERQAEKHGAAGGDTYTETPAGQREGSAERINHTALDDSEQFNARDDGEAGYGVEGATRGLHTGSVVPTALWISQQLALAEETQQDQAFFTDVELIGFEAWVGKNGDRKRAREAHEVRYNGIRRRVRDKARSIRQAACSGDTVPAEWHGMLRVVQDAALQSAWVESVPAGDLGKRAVCVNPNVPEWRQKFRGVPVAPPPSTRAVATQGRGVLMPDGGKKDSDSTPALTPKALLPVGPEIVYRDYWTTISVGGPTWGARHINAREWHRWADAESLSLMDLAGPGVRVHLRKRQVAVEWGRPLFVFTQVSLLDQVEALDGCDGETVWGSADT